eukprot:scaffold54_cov158-Amphora_coffeaeformis.AAC.13
MDRSDLIVAHPKKQQGKTLLSKPHACLGYGNNNVNTAQKKVSLRKTVSTKDGCSIWQILV